MVWWPSSLRCWQQFVGHLWCDQHYPWAHISSGSYPGCFMSSFHLYILFHFTLWVALKCIHFILICHCTSLSPWFIILDKNNFVKVSHHYLTSGGYRSILQPMPCGLIGMYWVKCKQSNSQTNTSLTTQVVFLATTTNSGRDKTINSRLVHRI